MIPRAGAGGLGAFAGGLEWGGEGGGADAGSGGVGVWVSTVGLGESSGLSMSVSLSLVVLVAIFCRLGRGRVVRLLLASCAASES